VILGFCSNGEYNSMRSKGENRPVSIFQIRSVARKKFSNLGIKTMKEMLTPKGIRCFNTIHSYTRFDC
jgi:hypothetical protein